METLGKLTLILEDAGSSLLSSFRFFLPFHMKVIICTRIRRDFTCFRCRSCNSSPKYLVVHIMPSQGMMFTTSAERIEARLTFHHCADGRASVCVRVRIFPFPRLRGTRSLRQRLREFLASITAPISLSLSLSPFEARDPRNLSQNEITSFRRWLRRAS